MVVNLETKTHSHTRSNRSLYTTSSNYETYAFHFSTQYRKIYFEYLNIIKAKNLKHNRDSLLAFSYT